MSNEANDKGWLLHSLAQARRFGPMSEDELRGYFRAGMVKSVDRLTAPGEVAMRPAAEVATMLGESVPVGPPPPEIEQAPTPRPSMAAGVVQESGEERAAKAAAAMNIDLVALMASSAPSPRRSGFVLPIIIFAALVIALLMGLNMLRKLQSSTSASAASVEVGPTSSPASIDDSVTVSRPQEPAAAGPRTVPTPALAPDSASDAMFETNVAKAQALQDTRNWTALIAFAKEWAAAQPDRHEPLLYLGLAHSGAGDYKLAVEPLQKVLAREPNNREARSMLADAYLQSERWSEAEAMYKQMVGDAPDDARLWNNYGAALNGSGQQVQAVAAMENAVRIDPGFKQAWTNLGNLYQSMGDTGRAAAAFANAR